jgi:DNA-binding MarR family transcriptional regulator
MPAIDFVLKRLSLTSTREELRTVAYALGEWLVARDESALSASYDRLRELRGAAPADSASRVSFDVLTNLLEGYFASAESVRRVERMQREVEAEPIWRAVMQCLASEPANQDLLCQRVGRAKSTVSVVCEDLRQRELIELVPNASRRENVHALTRLGKQVLARLPAEAPSAAASSVATAQPTVAAPAATTTRPAKATGPRARPERASGTTASTSQKIVVVE